MNRKKLILLALFLSISTSSCSFINNKEKINPYSKYSKGNVYIGSYDYLKSIETDKNDVLILDKRESNDPDIKIYNSYLITENELIDEILDILLEYEKEFPTAWDRSKDTMKLEWFVHNVAYYFNYQRDRTKDVDLNNLDEEYYKNKDFLPLILAKK